MISKIYIGPNGFGKTFALNEDYKSFLKSHPNQVIFLPSEIMLSDEIKDTIDSSMTMEYILSEIFSSNNYTTSKAAFEASIDSDIIANQHNTNAILDEVLSLNNSSREGNLIDINKKKTYKNLVSIEKKNFALMGSGQRMYFLLKLLKHSSKKYIFLDEPEKYSHPSMLNLIAKMIRDLSVNREIFLVTHSAKLLSMLEVDFNRLIIINDSSHTQKKIDFSNILLKFPNFPAILTRDKDAKSRTYFNVSNLIENIVNLHYREFIESLFSSCIYVVEGSSDALFVRKYLQDTNQFYNDYTIFISNGKHHMMIFCEIFRSLDIKVHTYFDYDNNLPCNTETNRILSTYSHYMFNPTLEKSIGFTVNKSNYVEFINHLYSIDLSAYSPNFN